MNIVRRLFELERVDQEIDSKEQAISEAEARLRDNSAVTGAAAELNKERERLEKLKSSQHSLDWQIDDLGSRYKADKEKLYSGRVKSPRELTDLQRDTGGLKKRLDVLEEEVLSVMEQVESQEKRVTSVSEELKRVKSRRWKEEEELTGRKKVLEDALAGLKEERQVILADIEPSVLRDYDELKEKKGTAVVRVEQGICRGCGISLSPVWLRRIKGGEVVRCSSCSRILFVG